MDKAFGTPKKESTAYAAIRDRTDKQGRRREDDESRMRRIRIPGRRHTPARRNTKKTEERSPYATPRETKKKREHYHRRKKNGAS